MNERNAVRSEKYHHSDTCDLAEDGHAIRRELVEAVEAATDRLEGDVAVHATGCLGCYCPSEYDAYFVWVAQGDATNHVAVRFGVMSDAPDEAFDVGDAIAFEANHRGIDVSWDGDPMHSVILGDDSHYDEEDGR